MKLVLLYGPPGVGKLTVAKALSAITGYRIYHNHIAVEAILPVFDYGTKEYNELVAIYRMELLKRAINSSMKGLIATFVYAPGIDDRYIKRLIRHAASHSSKICFVKLTCDKKELYRRVSDQSRREFSKIKSKKALKRMLEKYDIDAAISYVYNMIIDNTRIGPKKAAALIKEHYKL